MSTWANLLADIRTDLKDTGTVQKFTNGVLYLATKDAIRDYSWHFPRYVYRELLEPENGTYPLPENFIQAVDVECPQDTFLEERQVRPGVRFTSSTTPSLYMIEGSTLRLNAETTENVYLTFEARHTLPANEDDTTFVLSVPESDEELIRLYVKAKITEQTRTKQATLDRFKQGSGRRDDNPLEPEVGDLMGEYRMKIAERSSGGIILLFRPGRRR
jgi:hypothetical protein